MELRRPNSQYSTNYVHDASTNASFWLRHMRHWRVIRSNYDSLTEDKMLSTVDSNVMSTSKLQLFGSVLLFTGVPALLLNPFLRDWTKNNAVQQFWRRPILFMFRFFYLVQKYVELLIIRQCQKSKIRQM